MNQRKKFVGDSFATNIDIKAGDLCSALRDKFGKGLGFVEVKRLREAFVGGSFDRVWDELFRDEPTWEASTRALSSESKARGERRKKLAVRGRRGIDRDKVTLPEIRGHMVLYRTDDGFLNVQQFDSRKRASELVKQLMHEGVKPDDIHWFRRNELAPALAA